MNWLITKAAYAQAVDPVDSFVKKLAEVILNPFIVLLFAIALLYFLIGVFKFLSNTENADEREVGKSHMIWGIIGMFIMMSVFAIMQIIGNTIGSDVIIQN